MRFLFLRKWQRDCQRFFLSFCSVLTTCFYVSQIRAATADSGFALRVETSPATDAQEMTIALREMRDQMMRLSDQFKRESILSELKSYEESLNAASSSVQLDELEKSARLRAELERISQFMKQRYMELGVKPDPDSVIYKFYLKWMAANQQLGRSLGSAQVNAEAVAKELLGDKYDSLSSEQKEALKSKLSVLGDLLAQTDKSAQEKFLAVLEDLKSKYGIEPGAAALREAIASHSSLFANDLRDAKDPSMQGKFSISASEAGALGRLQASGTSRSWSDRSLSGLGLFGDRPLQFTGAGQSADQALKNAGPALINEDELLPYRDLLASAEGFNDAALDLVMNPDADLKHREGANTKRQPASSGGPYTWVGSTPSPIISAPSASARPVARAPESPTSSPAVHDVGTPAGNSNSNQVPSSPGTEQTEAVSGSGASQRLIASQTTSGGSAPAMTNKNTAPASEFVGPPKIITVVADDGSYRFVRADGVDIGYQDGYQSIPSGADPPTEIHESVRDNLKKLIDRGEETELADAVACPISDFEFEASSGPGNKLKESLRLALDVLLFQSNGKNLCEKSFEKMISAGDGCYEDPLNEKSSVYERACHSCLQQLILAEGELAFMTNDSSGWRPGLTPKESWIYPLVEKNLKDDCLKKGGTVINVVYLAHSSDSDITKISSTKDAPDLVTEARSRSKHAHPSSHNEEKRKKHRKRTAGSNEVAGLALASGAAAGTMAKEKRSAEADLSAMSADFCAEEFATQVGSLKAPSQAQKYAAFFDGLVRNGSKKDEKNDSSKRKTRQHLLAQIMFAKDPRCVNTSKHAFKADSMNLPGGFFNSRQCVSVDSASTNEVDKLRVAALNWWISNLKIEHSKESKALSRYDTQQIYRQSLVFHDANQRVRSADQKGRPLSDEAIARGDEWLAGIAWQIEKCPGWRELVTKSEQDLRAAAAKCGSIEAQYLLKNPNKAGLDKVISVLAKRKKPSPEHLGLSVKLPHSLELPKDPFADGRKPASLPEIALHSAMAAQNSTTPDCLELRKRYGFYLSSIVMPSTGESQRGNFTELYRAWEAANIGVVNENTGGHGR